MRRLLRSVWGLCTFFLLAAAPLPGQAADRNVTLLKNTDLPGFDYALEKGVDLEQCQQACTDDRICQAFTFNEKAGWSIFYNRKWRGFPMKTSARLLAWSIADVAKRSASSS